MFGAIAFVTLRLFCTVALFSLYNIRQFSLDVSKITISIAFSFNFFDSSQAWKQEKS